MDGQRLAPHKATDTDRDTDTCTETDMDVDRDGSFVAFVDTS